MYYYYERMEQHRLRNVPFDYVPRFHINKGLIFNGIVELCFAIIKTLIQYLRFECHKLLCLLGSQ